MRLLAAIFLLGLTGCVESYHVDDKDIHLYAEVERCRLSYSWEEEWLSITIFDSSKDFRDLQIIPGTAHIWTTSLFYQLIPRPESFDYGASSKSKEGKITSIGFGMKIDNPQTKRDNLVRPLTPGFYNISVQFNGASGVRTLCGRFQVIKTSEPYHDGLR